MSVVASALRLCLRDLPELEGELATAVAPVRRELLRASSPDREQEDGAGTDEGSVVWAGVVEVSDIFRFCELVGALSLRSEEVLDCLAGIASLVIVSDTNDDLDPRTANREVVRALKTQNAAVAVIETSDLVVVGRRHDLDRLRRHSETKRRD